MEGNQKTNHKPKPLIIALAILCLAAIVLGTIIAINHFNNPNPAPDNTSPDLSNLTEEEKAQLDSYNNYTNDYKKAREQAATLLNQEPVDVNAIKSLYANYIDQYTKNNELDRVSAFIRAEQEDLLSKGLKKEALDVLISFDFSIFDKPEQYRQYTSIISLAKELGENEIVSKYEPLAAEVKDDYDASYRGSEDAAAKFEAAENQSNTKEDNTTKETK